MSDQVVGGWSGYSCDITELEKEVFDRATANLLGVKYTPVAVATQPVAGTNYSFFCNVQGLYPSAPNEAAMVMIYAPPAGDPHITNIQRLPR